jgi:hypothetical protein
MNRNVPDRWVVVEITDGVTPVKKVLAGWYGGYGGGDSYQLSSTIQTVVEFDNRYEFHNQSGSVYVCHKNYHGMSGYMSSMYDYWKSLENDTTKIRILDAAERQY